MNGEFNIFIDFRLCSFANEFMFENPQEKLFESLQIRFGMLMAISHAKSKRERMLVF